MAAPAAQLSARQQLAPRSEPLELEITPNSNLLRRSPSISSLEESKEEGAEIRDLADMASNTARHLAAFAAAASSLVPDKENSLPPWPLGLTRPLAQASQRFAQAAEGFARAHSREESPSVLRCASPRFLSAASLTSEGDISLASAPTAMSTPPESQILGSMDILRPVSARPRPVDDALGPVTERQASQPSSVCSAWTADAVDVHRARQQREADLLTGLQEALAAKELVDRQLAETQLQLAEVRRSQAGQQGGARLPHDPGLRVQRSPSAGSRRPPGSVAEPAEEPATSDCWAARCEEVEREKAEYKLRWEEAQAEILRCQREAAALQQMLAAPPQQRPACQQAASQVAAAAPQQMLQRRPIGAVAAPGSPVLLARRRAGSPQGGGTATPVAAVATVEAAAAKTESVAAAPRLESAASGARVEPVATATRVAFGGVRVAARVPAVPQAVTVQTRRTVVSSTTAAAAGAAATGRAVGGRQGAQ